MPFDDFVTFVSSFMDDLVIVGYYEIVLRPRPRMIKSVLCWSILGVIFSACTAPMSRGGAPAPAPQFTGPAVRPDPPTLPELLKQIEFAYRQGDYGRGLALVQKAYELQQNDVSAMDRIGSVYYVLGRYGEALSVWAKALPLETDVVKRRELENSITVARRSLGLTDEAPAAVPLVKAAIVKKLPPPKERRAEIDALYKKGVKYYASGEYLQATTAFLGVLELEPGNADAVKALKRLNLDQ